MAIVTRLTGKLKIDLFENKFYKDDLKMNFSKFWQIFNLSKGFKWCPLRIFTLYASRRFGQNRKFNFHSLYESNNAHSRWKRATSFC